MQTAEIHAGSAPIVECCPSSGSPPRKYPADVIRLGEPSGPRFLDSDRHERAYERALKLPGSVAETFEFDIHGGCVFEEQSLKFLIAHSRLVHNLREYHLQSGQYARCCPFSVKETSSSSSRRVSILKLFGALGRPNGLPERPF